MTRAYDTAAASPSPHPAANDLPAAAWTAFRVLAVIAGLSAIMVVAGHFYGSRLLQSSMSTSPKPIQLVIGNDVLDVPENMIRHEAQRVPGVTGRVDLRLYWPERAGYRLSHADAFSDTDPETTQTVLISVAKRQWLLDMAGRLELVYGKAADASAAPRPVHGLTALRLDPAHGYVDETLYFAPSANGGALPAFIARCNEPAAGAAPLLLACETDLFFGETLEARIRFPAHFLADWARFRSELDAFLDGLQVRAE
ncbi:hypothetical protein [Oceaniradius stylonematis]|uniref:hypothetical protein n=1 Tax=Oceaniradius stylonematis TaxID=2184161 RepID=UPI00273EBFB2|nr:hypothetical protein [Oceaniradius stylonematis]